MSFPPMFPDEINGSGPVLDRKRLHDHWKGFVVLGALATALGLLALALTESATITSVLVIGVFMIVAGAAEITIGFRMRSWRRFVVWEIAGVLYLVAGGFAVLVPEVASVVITLLLGAGLVATGLLRIVFGIQLGSSPSRTMLFVSGVVTMLLGLVIVLGWPANSALILGTLLGIDLVFNGISWIFFGLRARTPA
ncbi:HdeD family acid-resistance protein [Lichenifustis flavocetrariae]|uniref:HdeD family acid-resistance protein n=1 Tax=Lichenifustis flavocetrariae TaxID=2949735 RepID=A0AA41YX27_9HYPH|nr:HdeD family acid-resistance protein [Lichenifustis flavocetrariae]MCW6510161.1 HdeD family acid-resistance protein [Lichenifustis flavocetrariae]